MYPDMAQESRDMSVADAKGRRVALRHHPDGALRPSDFAVEDQQRPSPEAGQFLVRTTFISVDPMLRLFVDRTPFGGGMPALPLGTTIPGAAVGEVVESRHPDYAVGDLVEGRFGWQSFALSDGNSVIRVNPHLGPPENALGIAGLPGFTAYVGLEAAGGVKPGQTVLVSGAAGAVGSAVGVLIRARGGRAVGIAGGADKCRYLVDRVGYEAAVDRHAPDFLEQLKAALPKGADIYFDNVGGPLLASIVPLMARGGLVLISGLMAQYQGSSSSSGDNLPAVLRAVMFNGLRIQGFTQAGRSDLRPGFEAELAEIIAMGGIDIDLHIEDGIERLPDAMCGLFEKSTTGKVLIRVETTEQEQDKAPCALVEEKQ
jgi:NADPH-dependent curcumin reductase